MLRILRSSGGLSRPLHQQIRRRSIKLIKQTTVAYSTDTTSFSKVNEPTDKSTELRKHYDDGTNDLIERIRRSRTGSNLMETIEPHLDTLKSGHLQVIFNQMIDLFIKSRSKLTENNINAIQELYVIAEQSPVFKSLLDRTVHLDEELSIDCLLTALHLFQLIQLDPTDDALKCVLKNSVNRLKEFELYQLSGLLISLNHLANRSTRSTDFYSKLVESILEVAKFQILNANQLDTNDVGLMVSYFEVFLFKRDVEVLNYLVKQLTSSHTIINFAQSIELLRNIKKSTKHKVKATWPSELDLNELIKKCNSSIVKTLKLEPKLRNVNFYLSRLHASIEDSGLNLENLNDPMILDTITPILIRNQKVLNIHVIFCLFYMLMNFGRNHRYNERLMRLGYDLICKRNVFDKKLFSHFCLFFYHLRLPFVDYRHLSKLTLDWVDERELTRLSLNALVQLLSELVLNDVNDQRILNCSDALLKRLNQEGSREISFHRIIDFNQASVHLSLFSRIDHSLRSEVGRKFGALLSKIPIRRRLKIQDDYSQFTDKIQLGAYLSNGLFLSQIAIYDRSTRDLVPLTKFKHYFDQIDRIPLDENQQLLTLIVSPTLKGNVGDYELSFFYHLNKLLNNLNIKIVKIFSDDIKHLTTKEVVDIFIEKALDTCR